MTEDISYSGLFVRTDETSLRGEVIGLRITIPDHGQTLSLHAMVAHSISWDHAARWQQGPGWGLQLQGIQGESLKAWNGFVARVIALHDARSLDEAAAVVDEVSAMIEPIRRRYPRRTARFDVKVQSVDDLFEVLTRDISKGGAFLLTDQLLPKDSPVALTFTHPEDGSSIAVDARVVRVVTAAEGQPGLGVAFMRSAVDRWLAFEGFIQRGIEEGRD